MCARDFPIRETKGITISIYILNAATMIRAAPLTFQEDRPFPKEKKRPDSRPPKALIIKNPTKENINGASLFIVYRLMYIEIFSSCCEQLVLSCRLERK